MNREELFVCDSLWKIFNEGRSREVTALEQVTLNILKGTLTIFSGPSGSGKTTLLSILGALERPSRGRLSIEGREITVLSDVTLSRIRRETTGFVFQHFQLMPGLTAWENTTLPLLPAGSSVKERKERALELLELVGLSARVNHAPEEMSGGEQQRVALARAMVCDPPVLLLDEPLSNIDAENAVQIIAILERCREEGKTILISSHDGDMSLDADRVVHLRNGRIIEGETAASITANP